MLYLKNFNRNLVMALSLPLSVEIFVAVQPNFPF